MSTRRRLSSLLAAALVALACGRGGAAEETRPDGTPVAGGVALVRIEDELGAGTQALLTRGVERAVASGARTLIVELDTPGGPVQTMWRLTKAIEQAAEDGLRTVAWINPRALSAGALLALSCERVYGVGHGTIGAAQPVMVVPGGGVVPVPEEGGIQEKQISALRAQFRATAQKHGRSAVLAEGMVDPDVVVNLVRVAGELRIVGGGEWEDMRARGERGELLRRIAGEGTLVTLTVGEAIELAFIDGEATTLEALLEKVGHGGERVEALEAKVSEELLSKLEALFPVLLAIGLMLLWTEFKSPGFGVAGIAGVACLALMLVGRYLVGLADVPHLAMVGVGLVLVAVELFVAPGTLWFGLLGAMLFVGGLFLAQVGPGFAFSSPLDRELAYAESFRLITTLFLSLIGAWTLLRFLPRLPIFRQLITVPSGVPVGDGAAAYEFASASESRRVGRSGVALTALHPVGKVRLDGEPDEEFEARADGPALDVGARVRVLEARAGRLLVRAAGEEQA